MKKIAILSLISLFLMLACKDINTTHTPMNHTPPTVDKIAKNIETHGDAREDGYYWLNEKENPEVIDYLERENDYYQKMTAHTQDFQKELFEEMKARIK